MTKIDAVSKKKEVIDAINDLMYVHPDFCTGTIVNSIGDYKYQAIAHDRADVLVLDYDLFGNSYLQSVKSLMSLFRKCKVLIVSGKPLESEIRKFFKAGVFGYLLEGEEHCFAQAIHTIRSGEYYFSEQIIKIVMSGLTDSPSKDSDILNSLSNREMEVLELVVEGYTSKEIGEILFIAESTVDKHRRNIIGKTGVSSSRALIKYFYKQDVVMQS